MQKLPDDFDVLVNNTITHIRRQLEKQLQKDPDVEGCVGILYALVHTSESIQDLERYESHLKIVIDLPRATKLRVSMLEGLPGAIALQIVVAKKIETLKGSQSRTTNVANGLFKKLCHIGEHIRAELPPGECEVLYGRCGFLSVFLYLIEHDVVIPQDLLEITLLIAHQVHDEGKRFGSFTGHGKLCYSWHDKQYVGAAHGILGIVHILSILSATVSLRDDGVDKDCTEAVVVGQLERFMKEMNIVSSLESRKTHLVQWCHGAPGALPVLIHAASNRTISYEARRRLEDSILQLGETVWEYGLLRKGVGLCHGVSGNGFALLSIYRHVGNTDWLRRAKLFAYFGIANLSELFELPDHPYSLFQGLAGFYLFLHAIQKPSKYFFPCFEFRPRRMSCCRSD